MTEVTFGFGVTPEQVQSVGNSCLSTAEEVASQLTWLQGYVEDLQSQWLGIASSAFGSLMTDWHIYATMLHQALTGIGDGLLTNHLNYTSSEDTNVSSLQTVNGALPGAPTASIGPQNVIS